MDVIRIVRKVSDYTCIDNGISRDESLSLQERGLMLTVLSLPNSWTFNIQGLASILKESKPSISKVIQALINHGYCKREMVTDKRTGRIVKWQYTFYEVKNGLGCESEPESNFPDVEIPQCGDSTSGKVATIKYNKESSNNKSSKERGAFTPPTLQETRTYWQERTFSSDPDEFWAHFTNCDWKLSSGKGAKMKDWRLAAIQWEKREKKFSYGK